MRGRRWVLFLLLVLVTGIALYSGLFRYYRINERAERLIADVVAERLGVSFSSESFSILPWAVRLHDVTIESSAFPVTVTIRRIRLTFNVLSLLLHDFQPLSISSELFLDEPVVIWQRRALESTPGSLSIDRGSLTFDSVPSARINVVNGAVQVTDGDSTLVVADRLTGWIDGYSGDEVAINVQGSVLADDLNMTCRGSLDKLTRRLVIDMESRGCNLAAPNMELVSGDIAPDAGTLDLITHAEIADGDLALTGAYSLDGGSFRLKTLDIGATDIMVEGHLNEREIVFESVTGAIWGMKPHLSGHILLQPEPMLELTAHAEEVDIAQSLAQVVPGSDDLPGGTLAFSAAVSGPLRNLTASADLSVESLTYRDTRLDSLALTARLAGDILSIDSAHALAGGYRITADARLRQLYRNDERPFTISAAFEPLTLSGTPTSIALRGMADTAGDEYESTVDLRMDALPTPITGEILYSDGQLTCAFSDSTIAFDGTVTGIPKDIAYTGDVRLVDTPLLEYTGQTGDGPILNGAVTIAGTIDSLTTQSSVRVRWGQNLNSLLTGETAVSRPFSDDTSVRFDGRLLDHHLRFSPAMSWDVSAVADRSRVEFTITEPDGADLNLGIDTATGALNGRLVLDSFPLEWIIAIFVREEFSHKGRIYGAADIGGTTRDPSFSTPQPLRVTDMTLAGMGRLDGTTNVSGSLRDLRFTDVNLRRKEMPLFRADGIWVEGEPFILEASADGIDLSAIDDMISRDRRTDGRASFDVRLIFGYRHGTIDGTFNLQDGHFYDIPIDQAAGRFTGGSDGFMVEDFTVEHRGVYSGTGRAESGYFWRDKTETPGLNMRLMVEGDLIRALPTLTGALTDATGDCRADLTIGGTWQEPFALGGELAISHGTVKPAFLIDEVTDIEAILHIDPDTPTPEGLRAVRVLQGTGMVGDRTLTVTSLHPADDDWQVLARPGMRTIPNEGVNLDFGVLRGSFQEVDSRETTLKLHVPGFMEDGETGVFDLTGRDDASLMVGASDDGEQLTPYVSGHITVLSGDINYPLVEMGEETGSGPDTAFLDDMFWDLSITAGSNVNYVKEYNLELGGFAGTTLWQNEIKIDENSEFEVVGRLSDGTFRVTGIARSTTGFVSYYGYRFDIDYAELELDTANELKPAILTGRARTIVYDDTLGTENDIYLHVDFVDRESGRVTEARGDLSLHDAGYDGQNRPQTRFDAGALGIIEIRFSSSNPTDDSQELILAKLGISPGNFGAAATRALTAGIDNYYFNPLLRPFEEKIKRMLRLDMVKITPSIIGTFAQQSFASTGDVELGTDTFFVDRSRIMVGEYFLRDWFVSYTGQYGVGRDFLFRKERGFYHDIGLQYTVERNLRFQGRYIYDDIIDQDDARVEFRYDFTFD